LLESEATVQISSFLLLAASRVSSLSAAGPVSIKEVGCRKLERAFCSTKEAMSRKNQNYRIAEMNQLGPKKNREAKFTDALESIHFTT
jgi:hypothetical protein